MNDEKAEGAGTKTFAQMTRDELMSVAFESERTIADLRIQLANATLDRDGAETRFVNARAENDQLQQEVADLTNELIRGRAKLVETQSALAQAATQDDLSRIWQRGVTTGFFVGAAVVAIVAAVLVLAWRFAP